MGEVDKGFAYVTSTGGFLKMAELVGLLVLFVLLTTNNTTTHIKVSNLVNKVFFTTHLQKACREIVIVLLF
jgi:hypothetical protein